MYIFLARHLHWIKSRVTTCLRKPETETVREFDSCQRNFYILAKSLGNVRKNLVHEKC